MKKINLFLLLSFHIINGNVFSQSYKNVSTVFSTEQVYYSEFGDYDNDQDLDILIQGNGVNIGNTAIKIFRNDNGVYVNSGFNLLSNNQISTVKWGDFDRDGDLDLAVVGGGSISFYKNDLGLYSLYSNSIYTAYYSGTDGKWGDADNDGDLDFIATGSTSNTNKTYLLINSGIDFTPVTASFSTLGFNNVEWGDYDSDGDQDLLFTTSAKPVVYINNSLTFTLLPNPFPALPFILYNNITLYSSIWEDYDLDGDLDIVTMGREDNTPYDEYSAVYENKNGSYVPSSIVFAYNMQGQMMKVADVENDGDLDFVSFSTSYPWMETNTNGTYTLKYFDKEGYLFEGLAVGSSNFADYDNDGYLDILHTGRTLLNSAWVAYLLSGNKGAASYKSNTAPSIPANLSATIQGNDVTFQWNPSVDGQTPQAALTYNLRIGKTPGGSEILSAMSNSDGRLLLTKIGNCNLSESKPIKGIADGTYYWSVQAVDNGFLSSPFALEQTFTIGNGVKPPTLVSPVDNAQNQSQNLMLQWNKSVGAQSYQRQIAYDTDFNQLVSDKMTTDTTRTIDSLRLETTFYWRVRAVALSDSSSWSEIRSFKTRNYFTDILASLTTYTNKLTVDWGDYDNDGDLDLISTGYSTYPNLKTQIYQNDNGTLKDILFNHSSFGYFSAKWIDIDHDNDLDIFFNGCGGSAQYNSKVYLNVNGSFQPSGMIIPGNTFKDVEFIDCDHDGDLDILAASSSNLSTYDDGLYLMINQNDTAYSIINTNDEQDGAVAWLDIDNDGDFDFFSNGIHHSYNSMQTYLSKNTNATFSLAGHSVVGAYQGELSAFDYDGDGDLDLLMSGMIDDYSMELVTRVYKNTNGNFTNINATMAGTSNSNILWGDYDNDGDPDILTAGNGTMYRNDLTIFNQSGISFGGNSMYAAMGDYDNDGDLDLAYNNNVFQNNSYIFNTKPFPSTSKVSTADSGHVFLSWAAFTDAETSPAGLSYNLYVKSLEDDSFVMAPSADLTTGKRKIAAMGNVQNHTSYFLNNVKPGLYVWSVQAIDNTFEGSTFAPADTLAILEPPVLAYPSNNASGVNPQLSFKWFNSTYATSYRVQVSAKANFSTIVIDSLISDTTFTVRLDGSTTYYWRVQATRNNSRSRWPASWKFNTLPSIETVYLSNPVICKNAKVNLTVKSTATLLDSLNNAGTKYIIELIDHSQNSTYFLDTVSIKAADILTVTLPPTITIGSTYKFKIQCLDSNILCFENKENVSIRNDLHFTFIPSPSPEIQLCRGDSIQVSAIGDSDYTYEWSTGDAVPGITVNSPGTYYLVVTDTNQCTYSDSIHVTALDCYVWPGDANNDGSVNNFDLLPLGLYYSETGTPRNEITYDWHAYFSSDWTTTQPDGVNKKHADCNGDGVIDNKDTLAIHQNFTFTRPSYTTLSQATPYNIQNITSDDPDLYIVNGKKSFIAGEWVNAEIWLGNGSRPVNDFYGIAFTINYNAEFVQPGTERIIYNNSWIGMPGTNVLTISHIEGLASKGYGAITRTDHANISGQGKIAEFRFQTKSSISSPSTLYLSISDYKAIDAAAAEQQLNTPVDSIHIQQIATGITGGNAIEEINISPNPFKEQTVISIPKTTNQQVTIKIVDVLGKEVKSFKLNDNQGILEKGEMNPGIYFLILFGENKNWGIRKIIVE